MQTNPAQLYGGPRDGEFVEIPEGSGNLTMHDGSRYTITHNKTWNGVAIYAYAGTERSLNVRKEAA